VVEFASGSIENNSIGHDMDKEQWNKIAVLLK